MKYQTNHTSRYASHSVAGDDEVFICNMDHCDKQIADGIGMFLCPRHLQKAWAAYQIYTGEAEAPPPKADIVEDPRSHNAPGVIYVMRVGERYKIGWTRNSRARAASLKADAVLFEKSGTRHDEAALHRMFRDHLDTGHTGHQREWFFINDESTALVDKLRRAKTPQKKVA